MTLRTLGTNVAALNNAFVDRWAALTVYTAGHLALAPDGTIIQRNANGTSRATYDATEQAAWTVKTGAGGGSPLTDVAATVTASGALTVGKHNPVDATSGARTMTLADATAAGQMVSVSKKDTSTNTVTVSVAHLRDGGAGTIVLTGQFEALLLVSKADGTWWPVGDHKTKAFLDATYLPIVGPSAGNDPGANASGLHIKKTFATSEATTTPAVLIEDTASADTSGYMLVVKLNNSPAGGSPLVREALRIDRNGGVGVWDFIYISPYGAGNGVLGASAMFGIASDLPSTGFNQIVINRAHHAFFAANDMLTDSTGNWTNVLGMGDLANPRRFTMVASPNAMLALGPLEAAVPAIKQEAAALAVRAADDSGYLNFRAGTIRGNGDVESVGTGNGFIFTRPDGTRVRMTLDNTNTPVYTVLAAATAVVTDTFTGTNGTALTAHTADLAPAAWVAKSSTYQILSNQAQPASSSTAIATIASGAADVDVKVTPQGSNASQGAQGLVFRFSDTSNYWRLYTKVYVGTLGNAPIMLLDKVVAGTVTTLKIEPVTTVNGQVIEVIAVGSLIRVLLNGKDIAAVKDSFNSTAQLHGLFSASVFTLLDNFSVSTVAA